MATNYTGNVTPSLSNAPANAWTDDATKASHVGNTYLVTGSGGTAGNVYSFEEYAAPVIKSATGLPADIVTITDGGDNKNALKATASLSPIQSLNGYDHPWAGGAGKNRIDPNDLVAGFLLSSGELSAQDATRLEYSSANYIEIPTGTTAISFGYNNFGSDIANRWSAICLYDESYSCLVRYTALYSDANAGIGARSGNNITTYPTAKYVKFSTRTYGHGLDGCYLVFGTAIDLSFAPYENLCPISGHTGATLKIGAEYPTADREYTSSFGQTVYGGTFDFVSGKLVVTWAMIASYNGEVLPARWLSDRDVYAAGTTPTIGAQVVYELATPIEIDLTPTEVQTLLGLNNVWASDGQMIQFQYRSNQFQPEYNWFENWTMPKITRNNGNITVLPFPQEYTPEIYDVDAATTGRNAAGTMIRDRVARKHKFNYKFPPLSQADATEILAAVQDASFTLTTASPETGAKTNYTVYVGDRSLPVYWMPNHDNASWLYSSLSLNLIEM